MADLLIHSDEVSRHVGPVYSPTALARLESFLFERRILDFRPLPGGLYPAAQVGDAEKSGYQNVWVRDNVHVAHAHYINGRVDAAVAAARSLAEFFSKSVTRFDRIIAGTVDRDDPMNRVHVRFDGATLSELPEKWPHAQNDALGYFVWLFCRLTTDGALPLTNSGLSLLEKFAAYFAAIQYWSDEDSGHWEEASKISASSIGVIVGGLEAMAELLQKRGGGFDRARIEADLGLLDDLARRGRRALDAILPAECVQPEKTKRWWDAALLFLVYPIGVVDPAMAERIVGDVAGQLQGDVGIRRYLGDSYWCGDYRALFVPEERSGDFSGNMERRDRLLKAGQEAQWCVFDPILSAIFGNRYLQSGNESDRDRQIAYFNRSLGQITNTLQCPEAYFLERNAWVPNDNIPLLWTQANLWVALKVMKDATAMRA
jgi:phosphorylase kinase alpha/beta subunit